MDLYDEIAKVAYELYKKSGYIQGCDREHWLEAEKIVMVRLAEGEKKKKEEKKIKSEKKPATKTKKTAKKKTK
jgi:Protein of unknown function (DUF2934)